MPENDPIQRLESFGTGGVTVTPLPPTEVRRLGDRRRTRRRTGAVLAAAAVVAAIAVPVGLTLGDDDGPGRRDLPPAAATTITYPGQGVFVSDPADVDQLTGTSPAFRAFVATQARRLAQEGAACPDAAHGVTVQKYGAEGYALGAVNACGGYAALWVERDGTWQEGMGTQDAWDCDTLAYLDVPRSFTGGCADEAGGFGPAEVDGLRLGMTEKEVERAGGDVLGSPTGEPVCRSVRLPYRDPLPDRADGAFSEEQGLAAVFARSGDRTPERVGLGSSLDDVRAAYPAARKGANGYWTVAVKGAGVPAEYQFGIDADGTVGEMVWTRTDQQCFG